MAVFNLGYGDRTVSVSLPDKQVLDVLYPYNNPDKKFSEKSIIEKALCSPIGTKRLCELVHPKQKIVIITSDHTRPMPTSTILPYILKELFLVGVKESDITVIFASGSHRKPTEAERLKIVGEEFYSKIKCIPSNNDDVIYLGTTSRGTPVEIMRAVVDADIRICLGNIEFHYFAGFSGGCKALLPGVASLNTIKCNHSLMMDSRSYTGNVEDNPVRLDLEEGATFCPPTFLFNVVLNEHKKIEYAVSGDYIKAHRVGCSYLRKTYLCPLHEEADIVIASMGGAPKDLNLYQAQKAIDNAFHAVKKGGIIVLIASCQEGFGEKTFEKWIREAKNHNELIERLRNDFQLGGHKAAAIAKVLNKAEIFLFSEMKDSDVNQAFINPIHDLQYSIDTIIKSMKCSPKICVMPFAGSTLPIVK